MGVNVMKNLLRLVLLTALLVGATASLARPAPGHAAGTGGIIGAVFFDADADGIRDAPDNSLEAGCLFYTSPSPRGRTRYPMPSST